MTSYLEILALGAFIRPRDTSPKKDPRGRDFRTDGVLVMSCSPEIAPTLRAAVSERYELAKQILAGHKTGLPVKYGACDTCGQAQEDFKAGRCLLCRAAIQKVQTMTNSTGL